MDILIYYKIDPTDWWRMQIGSSPEPEAVELKEMGNSVKPVGGESKVEESQRGESKPEEKKQEEKKRDGKKRYELTITNT